MLKGIDSSKTVQFGMNYVFLLSMNSYILRSSKIYAFNFNQRRQEISDAPAKEEQNMEVAVSWKEYFRDDARYVDIINGIGCGGQQLVKSEDLQEADTQTLFGRLYRVHGKDSCLYPAITFVLYGEKCK